MKSILNKLIIMLVCISVLFAVACDGGNANNGSVSSDSGEEQPQDTLSIDDIYTWVGDYPASEIYLHFSNPEKAEKVTFTYDAEKLTIDEENLTVKGLVEGKYRVKAVSPSYTAQFAVMVKSVDPELSYFKVEDHWQSYVSHLKTIWYNKGTAGKTTLFIGDSFFDEEYFWTNFYEDYYPGKDALCFGIGSTTSFTWETLTPTFLANLQPRNIVMHIGTNNIYDKYGDADYTVENIQRMFLVMHEAMPQTKIYYFAITQRAYEDYRHQWKIVTEVNEIMQKWCADRDWITFLDTCDQLPASTLKDKIHPLLEYYKVFTDALEASDIVIDDYSK